MHRRSILFTLAVVALGAMPFVPLAQAKHLKPDAKPPKCEIKIHRGHTHHGHKHGGPKHKPHWETLQAAQDAAAAGDTLKVKGTCDGVTTLTKDLTIVGKSNHRFGVATLDGDQAGSVLTIGEGVSVTIRKLTITGGFAAQGGGIVNGTRTTVGPGGIETAGGSVTLTDSTVSGNTATGGGGIANAGGSLTLNNSTVSDNTSSGTRQGGGTIFGDGGGGILNSNGGSVTLANSTVTRNSAVRYGGGILTGDAGSVVTLTDSIVSDNISTGNLTSPVGDGGGGILNALGSVTLIRSTVSHNSAVVFGGGIDNVGSLTLIDSTVTDNHQSLIPATSGGGGGISHFGLGPLTLTDSTVSGNTSTRIGGGIYKNGGGPVTLTDSTVTGNTAGTSGGGIYNTNGGGPVTLTNSIVSDNTSSGTLAGQGGGGIINQTTGSSVTLTDSTVSGNTAALDGGGIRAAGGAVTLTNTTVTGNHATTGTGGGINRSGTAVVTLTASTVTGNTPDNCFDLVC